VIGTGEALGLVVGKPVPPVGLGTGVGSRLPGEQDGEALVTARSADSRCLPA
jgi:hypothetical protein